MELARSLDGLPLALATAGTYLKQTSDSCSNYLQLYHNSWDDLGRYSQGLLDYDGRTLYSTWNILPAETGTALSLVVVCRTSGVYGKVPRSFSLFNIAYIVATIRQFV